MKSGNQPQGPLVNALALSHGHVADQLTELVEAAALAPLPVRKLVIQELADMAARLKALREAIAGTVAAALDCLDLELSDAMGAWERSKDDGPGDAANIDVALESLRRRRQLLGVGEFAETDTCGNLGHPD